MGIHNQTGERIEQNHRGCKNGSRNNKEITNADNSGPKKKNLGKKSEVIDAISITNRIEETEKRISGVEDTIENMDTTVKENAEGKKLLSQNIQEIQDTMRRPNLRIIGIEESEDFQFKWPANIFNKIIEENFPNLKR
jgi:L-fucose isomerase-like protein